MWTIYSFYERKPWAAYIVMLVSVKNKKKKKIGFYSLIYSSIFLLCNCGEDVLGCNQCCVCLVSEDE